MQAAADSKPSSMVSVLKLDVEKVDFPSTRFLDQEWHDTEQCLIIKGGDKGLVDLTSGREKKWICRVSIPVPRRCERHELPIVPQTHDKTNNSDVYILFVSPVWLDKM